MNVAKAAAVIAGAGTFCALVFAALFWRVEVRHSAPYGFSKTIDFSRLLAVSGGYVTANYPDFDRVDLDLRAYDEAADYDLTIHIMPAQGAQDIRTIGLDVPGSSVPHSKPAFADPFTTVRFDPIADSNGKTYYVWVERGPRNREDVVTVWSIKSYSQVPARRVAAAMLQRTSDTWGIGWLSGVAALTGIVAAALASWTVAALIWAGGCAKLGRTTKQES